MMHISELLRPRPGYSSFVRFSQLQADYHSSPIHCQLERTAQSNMVWQTGAPYLWVCSVSPSPLSCDATRKSINVASHRRCLKT